MMGIGGKGRGVAGRAGEVDGQVVGVAVGGLSEMPGGNEDLQDRGDGVLSAELFGQTGNIGANCFFEFAKLSDRATKAFGGSNRLFRWWGQFQGDTGNTTQLENGAKSGDCQILLDPAIFGIF